MGNTPIPRLPESIAGAQPAAGMGVGHDTGRDTNSSDCVIVALGASAGGLEALEDFFKHMPADSGAAFIVVQHLSPDHDSALVDLLGRCTAMPVQEAQDEIRIVADHVYVIPPNATLTVKNRTLQVAPPTEARGRRTPIDHLFSSLAEDRGEDAVCILLSGTGSDGTGGLRSIKENGGMAMAQSLATAKYDAMLRSAVATGLVDHVLPIAEMPAKLLDYVAHLGERERSPDDIAEQIEKYRAKLHGILRRKVGHDFSEYKEGTFTRRLERRMNALQITSVERYSQIFERQPEEAKLLFKDLLIGVTEFFRDPQAFEALEREVIPQLFQRATLGTQLRVCVVGCATGEEAYSIAILLWEHAATLENPPEIKIFATDIDDHALKIARKGYYTDSIAAHVSPGRLKRFFTKEEGGYQVKRQIREVCLFTNHSFIKDPLFSRLDLLSCRNVMIYMAESLQRKVVPLLHYALRQGGYLFLGSSESFVGYREFFNPVNLTQRIFQKADNVSRSAAAFSLAETFRRRNVASRPAPANEPGSLARQLERTILQRYAPACAVVNEFGEVAYCSGGIGRYLEQSTGGLETNLVSMASGRLRVSLRTALHHSVSTQQRIVHKRLEVDGRANPVDLLVEPLFEFKKPSLYTVLISDSVNEEAAPTSGTAGDEINSIEIIQRLERELELAGEQNQAMFQELGTANEELSSANEEFQVTNEELETSKEELQSFNEELETVNFELSRKIDELDAATSDMQNLLNGTQIAMVFLDVELNVKNFTPAAASMFHLISSDIGRPITDLAAQTGTELVEDAMEVLAALGMRERQVAGSGGRHHQRRILPYRTVNNVISGVVITYTDITELRQAEARATHAKTYAESIVDTVRQPLVVLNHQMQIISASQAFYDVFHAAPNDILGRTFFDLVNGQWNIQELVTLLKNVFPGKHSLEDYRVRTNLPGLGSRTMLLNARRLRQGGGPDPLVLVSVEDVTERETTLNALQASERLQREIIEAMPATVYTTDASGYLTTFNQAAVEFSGRVPRVGADSWCLTWKEYALDGTPIPRDQNPMATAVKQDLAIRGAEGLAERPDGTFRNFLAYPTPLHDESGYVSGAVNMLMDITELRKSEKERLELLARERTFAAEQALHEAQSELARISRALTIGELTTSIAHEVNQPLAGIVTNAEACLRWLKASTPNLKEAQDSLELIVRDGNRASEVIRRIRAFLKKDATAATLLDVNEVIQESLVLATSELAKSQVEVKLDLCSEIPLIWGDRIQLQQVILNLLINANEAMADAERPRKLTVSSSSAGDTVTIGVQDSGIGLSTEKMERMFDPFFTTKPSGMGLGLSISRSIVEAHGGRIWATPNEDFGMLVQFKVVGGADPS